jgi:hypothetical protein
MSLATGGLAAGWLRFNDRPGWHRIFAALLLAIAGFWVTGEMIICGVADRDDLAFALRRVALSPHWLWRGVIALAGGSLYIAVLRTAGANLPRGVRSLSPISRSSALPARPRFFHRGDFAPALREGVLESFGCCGLLYLGSLPAGSTAPVELPRGELRVVALALMIVSVFWLSLGRGIVG